MIWAFDELCLDVADAGLHEALLLLGRVILGVFLEIAVRARSGDRGRDFRPLLDLEAPQLLFELRGAARGQWHFAHSRGLRVQVLQPIHDHVIEMVEGVASGLGRCQRRVVRHFVVHGLASDRMRLADRLFALGRVDDQADLAVLDHVHDVRAALAHLVDAAARHAALGERLRRPARRDDLEAALDEQSCRARPRRACRGRAR